MRLKLFLVACIISLFWSAGVSGVEDAYTGGAPDRPGQAMRPADIDFCGTELNPEQIELEQQRLESDWTLPSARAISDYYVPIAFHIVRHSDGTGGLPPERLHHALYDLNRQFEQLGIKFFRLRDLSGEFEIHYVDSDHYYYNTTNSTERTALRQEDPVPDAINVWFVPSLGGACGYGTFTTHAVQGILMANACSGNESNATTLAHEVGHYLDLYHPHEDNWGVECPDSSNCGVAGDLLCDTPADPNLSGKVSGSCSYVGSPTPPGGCGGTYNPDVSLLMSYAPNDCKDTFSPMQIDKMLYTLTTLRPNLLAYDQTDTDGDGIPDLADNCPTISNVDQDDSDWDAIGNDCDACPNDWLNDIDGDGLCADLDNCPTTNNVNQLDADTSGVGDICQCTDGVMQFTGPNKGDNLGWRARSAGDINDDGFEDIVVSMINAETGIMVSNGLVHVYSGEDGSLMMEIEGEASGAQLGFGIGSAGDVNNDGYDDIILGAWGDSQSGFISGRTYIFLGTAGPFPLQLQAVHAYRTHVGAPDDALGTSVDGVGDLDDDGYDDYIIGASQWYGPPGGYVKAYSGQSGSELFTMTAEADYDRFGYSVRNAGDVNNDGTNDIVVGAFDNDAGGNGAGRVYSFSGVDGSLIHTFTGAYSGSSLGGMVSGAGDVNNDGFDDVIAGAPFADIGFNNSGSAYVYSGFDGSVLWSFHGDHQGDLLGWAVSGLGDMNQDGYDDLAVGAPRADYKASFIGWVYAISGQDGTVMDTVKGNYAGDWFGRDVYGMSDFNQDGINDLLVGAFSYNGDSGGEGRAYVYYMGDGDEDGIMVGCDNCAEVANPGQADADDDGIGDLCDDCCGMYAGGITGNVNCGTDGKLTLSDITRMIDYVYVSKAALCCHASGNTNASVDCKVTLSDITVLIDAVYISKNPPADCISACGI